MSNLVTSATGKSEAKERTKAWLQQVYEDELNRPLGKEGEDYWIADIHDRGQTHDQVLANIKRSNEKWLGDTYEKELGRPLDEEGRKWWMGDLRGQGSGKENLAYGSDRPAQSRDQVLKNIQESKEAVGYQRGKGKTTETEEPVPSPWEETKYDYTPYKERGYNNYWDSVDAAADAGNNMTDDYYNRFLPQMRNEVLLGINEIGAAGRYHGSRYTGKPPTYADPKELFDYYKNKKGNSEQTGNSEVDALNKRIDELEKKYSFDDD